MLNRSAFENRLRRIEELDRKALELDRLSKDLLAQSAASDDVSKGRTPRPGDEAILLFNARVSIEADKPIERAKTQSYYTRLNRLQRRGEPDESIYSHVEMIGRYGIRSSTVGSGRSGSR